jgi:hypothetical protein
MAKPKRRTRRRNQALPDFPVGQYVPVEAIKVKPDGSLDVVIKDSALASILTTENRRNPKRRRRNKPVKKGKTRRRR